MKNAEKVKDYLIKSGKRVPKYICEAVAELEELENAWDDLRFNKYTEAEGENYLITCECYISDNDGKLAYGLTAYKWDGTWNEKPLSPTSKKTFKFKNYIEVYHATCSKRPDLKKELERFESGTAEKLLDKLAEGVKTR